MSKVLIGNVKGPAGTDGTNGIDGFSPTIDVARDTDDEFALKITSKNGAITTPNLKGADGKDSYTKDEIMEMSSEYGLFVDSRSTASTGYWHKLFTCKISAYSYTDINLKLSVMALYGDSDLSTAFGILNIRIRQGANGAIGSRSSVKWESCTVDIASKLNRFAVNAVPDSTGNYIEFYIYNNHQYAGYKVSVIDKSPRGSGYLLTFTGEVNWSATSELTELPTNGAIIYSTLGEYMVSKSAFEAATIDSGWIDLTLLNDFVPYQSDASNSLKVRKIGSVVSLAGVISPPEENALGSTALTPVAKLPSSAYYPKTGGYFIMQGAGGAIWLLQIGTSGNIYASRYRLGENYTTPPATAWMPLSATYLTN